jgi:predicted O-methyltransferase YrrM
MIFACNQLINDIRIMHYKSDYDGRGVLTNHEPDFGDKMTVEFRDGYMRFKWAVAHCIDPGRIFEIGVGSGVAALAFMDACPKASYMGIDNRAMERERGGPSLVGRAMELLLPFEDATVIEDDSQQLKEVFGGPYDLVHVDGDHRRDACAHDVTLAWYALADHGFILVDDARDTAVASGTFDALNRLRTGSLDWAYFEDTWTGNILIRKEKIRQ